MTKTTESQPDPAPLMDYPLTPTGSARLAEAERLLQACVTECDASQSAHWSGPFRDAREYLAHSQATKGEDEPVTSSPTSSQPAPAFCANEQNAVTRPTPTPHSGEAARGEQAVQYASDADLLATLDRLHAGDGTAAARFTVYSAAAAAIRRLAASPPPSQGGFVEAWKVRGAEFEGVYLEEKVARSIAAPFKGAVIPLYQSPPPPSQGALPVEPGERIAQLEGLLHAARHLVSWMAGQSYINEADTERLLQMERRIYAAVRSPPPAGSTGHEIREHRFNDNGDVTITREAVPLSTRPEHRFSTNPDEVEGDSAGDPPPAMPRDDLMKELQEGYPSATVMREAAKYIIEVEIARDIALAQTKAPPAGSTADLVKRLEGRANDADTHAESYAGQRQGTMFNLFAAAFRDAKAAIEALATERDNAEAEFVSLRTKLAGAREAFTKITEIIDGQKPIGTTASYGRANALLDIQAVIASLNLTDAQEPAK